tara:strand:+ start:417 stop:1424 length:1008 start_codon:yes stop_codon:yes gene_type:complete
MKENILIFGGSGYVGSKLIEVLLKKKFEVINYDRDLFGWKHLPHKNKKFHHIKGDIRNIKKIIKTLKKFKPKYIIHLACISNDPTFLLNSKLSREVNFESFRKLSKILKNFNISRFIFASTASVYGLSRSRKVTETHKLKPITLYNKYKAKCEKVFLKDFPKNMEKCIIRPATVCGLSPAMRFDVSVNILTNYAYNKKFIKVFGGKQIRPNIHIDDMIRLYIKLVSLKNFSKANNEIFNAGFENLSINNIAKKVKKVVEKNIKKKIGIINEKSNDVRSYRVNSDKIKKQLNFFPRKTVNDAINEITKEFKRKKLKDSFSNINYFKIKKLQKINFV